MICIFKTTYMVQVNLSNLMAPFFGIGSIVPTDGQWMALGVEDPLVEWQHLVIGEGQVQVLQRSR